MNATERKKRSRIAERLGLVATPRGYVTPQAANVIQLDIDQGNERINAEMKEPKK